MAIQFKNLVDVFEQRTGAVATDAYTLTVSTEQTSGATPNPGTGGLKVQYYSVSSGTTHGFGLVAGSSSSDFLTSGPMHFYTNSDLDTKNATGFAMVLDTSQRLGIGTTSPSSKLHADGVVTIDGSTDGTSGSLAIQDNYSGINHLANIGWNRSSGGPYFSYGLKQDGSADWKSTFANFSGKRTYVKLDEDSFTMAFAPAQNTSVGSVVTNVSEKIRFNLESGRLGIGTTNPTTPLEIVSSDNTLL